MIGYLKGKIQSMQPTGLILDVNGVGYLVNISINTFDELAGKEAVELYIHTSVREDAITLFGFVTKEEQEMFELLISVSGIGPKSAQTILSGIRVADLQAAISSGDTARLKSLPGIGKKTAERVILELKSKVDQVGGDAAGTQGDPRHEAVLALTTLGFTTKQAEKAVRDVLEITPTAGIEDIIKTALKKI